MSEQQQEDNGLTSEELEVAERLPEALRDIFLCAHAIEHHDRLIEELKIVAKLVDDFKSKQHNFFEPPIPTPSHGSVLSTPQPNDPFDSLPAYMGPDPGTCPMCGSSISTGD